VNAKESLMKILEKSIKFKKHRWLKEKLLENDAN